MFCLKLRHTLQYYNKGLVSTDLRTSPLLTVNTPSLPVHFSQQTPDGRKDCFYSNFGSVFLPVLYLNGILFYDIFLFICIIVAPKPEAPAKNSGSPNSSPPLASSGLYAIPAAATPETKKEVVKSYQTPSKITYQAPIPTQKPGADPRMGGSVVADGPDKSDNSSNLPLPFHPRKKSVPSSKTPVGSYCLVTPMTQQPTALPRTNTVHVNPIKEIPQESGTKSLSKASTRPKVNPRPPLQIIKNGIQGDSHVEHQTTAVARPPLPKRPDSSPVDANPPPLPDVSSLNDLYASVDKTMKNLKRQASDFGGGYSVVTVPVIQRTSSDDSLGSSNTQPSSPLYSSTQDDSGKGGFKGFMRSSVKDAKESIRNWGHNKSSRDSEHQPVDTKTVETRGKLTLQLKLKVKVKVEDNDVTEKLKVKVKVEVNDVTLMVKVKVKVEVNDVTEKVMIKVQKVEVNDVTEK